jgi:dihydropteroate synthase
VSVDTTKASVAARALEAGATIVNDISAGRNDPDLLRVVADAGAGYVAMHMQGEPRTMQDNPHYEDVVGEVATFLRERLQVAGEAGIAPESVMADPGIGFGKTASHNLTLLGGVSTLAERVGAPILIGASRKSFIGRLLGVDDPSARDDGTLATVVWALDQGAAMVRVHDVRGASRAATLRNVLEGATP